MKLPALCVSPSPLFSSSLSLSRQGERIPQRNRKPIKEGGELRQFMNFCSSLQTTNTHTQVWVGKKGGGEGWMNR